MKLKTSLFKKGLIVSDLKRFWWISVLYTIVLIFVMPINHYMQKFNYTQDNYQWLRERIEKDLNFVTGASQLLLLVFPVIICVLVFRYMQKSKSASLYHSLPVTRTALFINSTLSCLILFLVPQVVTIAVMLLLNGFSFLSAFYSVSLIMSWFLNSLLFGIMFTAMTVFVGMFTGSSIATMAFVYILNVLPVFLAEFIRIHLAQLLFGFNNYSEPTFYSLMPMIMLYKNYYANYTGTTIVFFIILTIALFAGALLAFRLRKPETAGDIITFKPVKPFFIYGVTFCGTLLGGSYLGMIGKSFSYLMFSYFFSALLAYVVVQMITNKSLKVLHTWKGYAGFALVLIALILGIKFDIFGYVNKIPDASSVSEVYMGYNINLWQNNQLENDNVKYTAQDFTVYKDPKNIENMIKLHRMILENRDSVGTSNYIAYKLKNGKKIVRYYCIDYDLYASSLGPIYESDEYKQNIFPILHQNAEDLKYINIQDKRIARNPVIVSDKSKLDAFKEAIRKDILKLDYMELIAQSQRVVSIDIIDNNDRSITYELRSSFKNTIDWLKKEGLYDKVVLKADEIASVTLTKLSQTSDFHTDNKVAQEERKVEISDKSLIQELLDMSFDVDFRNKNINYQVVFKKDQFSDIYGFSSSFDYKASPALQSYIDKIK